MEQFRATKGTLNTLNFKKKKKKKKTSRKTEEGLLVGLQLIITQVQACLHINLDIITSKSSEVRIHFAKNDESSYTLKAL